MNKTKQCNGCGKDTPIGIIHDYERYCYCSQCEKERNDPRAKPKVVEYIGGVRGIHPGARDGAFFLERCGFQPQDWRGIIVFVRESDSSPMGNIAIITTDGVVVVVNGRHELEDLLFNCPDFMENPITENLPGTIDSLHPEQYDMALTAWLTRDLDI